MDTKKGSADITIKPVDIQEDWSVPISIPFLWWTIVITIRFGLELVIILKYKLAFDYLRISMSIINLVLGHVKFTVSMIDTSISSAKLGVLKIGKIIGKRLAGLKKK